MKQTYTMKQKLKQLISILFPILVTQLGLYSMNFFDVTMSGHYSPADLAGVAIGSSLWVPIFTGLSGILLAVTPIVAQLIGSKQKKKVAYYVCQGIYLAVFIAIAVMLIGALLINPTLNSMNLENHVRQVAHDYLVALS